MGDPVNVLSVSDSPARTSWTTKPAVRTVIAIALPFATALIQHALARLIGPHGWFLFYPTVLASIWIGGVVPGLIATAISLLIELFVFVAPNVAATDTHFLLPAIVLAATSVIAVLFYERSRRAHRRLVATLAERHIFASLIDASNDFIAIAGLDGKLRYLNPAGRRLVGLAEDQPIAGTDLFDYFAADERAFAEDVIVKEMTERGHWSGESNLRRWNSPEPIPVSDTHFVIRDPRTRQPIGMATITRDISIRKRLERSLRNASAELLRAQTVAEVGSWRYDARTRELQWSDETYRLFGVPIGTAMTYDAFLATVHPDDRALVDERWMATMHSGAPYDLEHRIIANGQVRWIRAKAELELDDRGEVTGGLGIAQNITKRKRFEEEQRFLAEVGAVLASSLDYEETLRNIADLAVRDFCDCCIVDVIGAAGEIRRVRAACRDPSKDRLMQAMTRIPLEPAGQRATLIQPVPATMLASFTSADRAELEALRPRATILVPLKSRDTLFGAMALVSTSREYGPSDVALAEDLAHRAALSIENARLYAEARRAIKSRDEILGIVAHDLRNPLNTIALRAGLLRTSENDQTRRQIDAIERAAQRMNRLIKDLLDVTRIESGHLSLDAGRIATANVLADCVEAQRSAADAAQVDLRLELDQSLPVVWADRDRVAQIFENLIGNAVKFTTRGGQIRVGAAPRDNHVLFWVADTGVGISPEQLPHIFDRFWQTREARRHGAGLGLPIVKGLVEAHGGRIWVDSAPGRGTTCFFTIPTSAEHEARETIH
jgi:PAS domain S-box-containing protein